MDQLQHIAENMKKQGASDDKIRNVIRTFLYEKKRNVLAKENTLN